MKFAKSGTQFYKSFGFGWGEQEEVSSAKETVDFETESKTDDFETDQQD